MSHARAGLVLWLAHSSASAATGVDTFKTWADVTETIITTLAVIAGGIWAYFKFAKGRTFKPRLAIEISGQWLKIDRKQWLHARIRVKNIGASDVMLQQRGTVLEVRILAPIQKASPDYAKWKRECSCVILDEHAWIEPGETVSDDLLLNLSTGPVPVRLDARLIAGRTNRKRIEVNARQVLPADAVISQP
jgi:hypothetical protein